MTQTRNLEGKTALVTGASSGLGFAVAAGLAEAGARILLHDLIEPSAECADLTARFGVEAVAVAADLRQASNVDEMMSALLGRFDAIDIVVNNAVVRHFAPVEDFPPERWDEALAVNLTAPFLITRRAIPGMKRRGWGRIVNMSSIYANRAAQNRIDYVTTKTAILGMTRAVALETAQSGITCNAVCPGTLPTPAIEGRIAKIAASESQSIEDATRRYLAARQPSARFVSLKAVADLVAFLCSPAGNDMTGATLPIDGGWTAL